MTVKKRRFLIISCLILLLFSASMIYAQTEDIKIIFNENESYLQVLGTTDEKLLKAIVEKDGESDWLKLNIKDSKINQKIYLNQGIGLYKISIIKHNQGNTYKVIHKYTYNHNTYLNPFLSPEKDIEVNNREIYDLARQITEGDKTDLDKVLSLYEWIDANITYDFDKYEKHIQGNYNNKYGAMNTLRTKTGVCYDYATLFAALARSLDIETKVVMKNLLYNHEVVYHAWNEVKIDGEWVTLDTLKKF